MSGLPTVYYTTAGMVLSRKKEKRNFLTKRGWRCIIVGIKRGNYPNQNRDDHDKALVNDIINRGVDPKIAQSLSRANIEALEMVKELLS